MINDMEWIKKALGISELIYKQDITNQHLSEISKQAKRNADLQQKYNEAYNIR